ncbi:hypothetical protein MKW98_016232 [Papaver atlanticum]|uniref:Uncharacterized protein n=1 Tax=Papaver atlanticum TaxID=357466 RepID=A0AAD4SGV1_9MAGN|nr:hypothetical protein MKW98_016232 [Papaver atlanticum]
MEEETRADKKPKVEHSEKTFVLAYPVFFNASYIGALGALKFIEKHFKNVGREPDGECPYANSGPVTAMILEGHEVVQKVYQLTCNREQDFFWSSDGPTAYSSDSVYHAKQDIEMWFGQDSKASERSHLVHLLSGGKTRGPSERVYNTLKNDNYYRILINKPDLHGYFLRNPMSFLVIKPKAFGTCCVGEILSAVEYRSLKLVRMSECPDSIVWSDSSASSKTHGDDEYGIAMVVEFLSPKFELRDKAPDLKYIDFKSEVYLVGSNYVYQSKPDEMWRDTEVFFPYGLTIYTDPTNQYIFGKMFEPSLIGLDFEE